MDGLWDCRLDLRLGYRWTGQCDGAIPPASLHYRPGRIGPQRHTHTHTHLCAWLHCCLIVGPKYRERRIANDGRQPNGMRWAWIRAARQLVGFKVTTDHQLELEVCWMEE
ncbi:hypothetical protein GE21DRAFT_1039914 [Neurospora crassa]|nr:hypothetical protein B14D6.40 [imported] - Neurospora crassa [Neurospora crassa]KHE87603.1 hypothetical protein GE21DRAFT_1039914 [Neurospora crassa]